MVSHNSHRIPGVPVTRDPYCRIPKPTETAVESIAGDWSIACVKGREEKGVASRLAKAGVATYLPLVTVTHRRVRRINGVPRVRRERIELAAFPGYLFVATESESQRSDLFDARDVFQIIPVGNQGKLIRELGQIQRALSIDSELRVTDWIRKGVAAEVTCGPFLGMKGVVASRRGCRVFVLCVEMLGVGVELEVGDHELSRIEAA